ncbi:MAG: NAD(P)-dependent oxidoreductase [Acidobacteriota bacterium]
MRISITGGSGFIGSHLAEYARELGHEVRCLVAAELPPQEAPTVGLLEEIGCEVVRGDLRDFSTLERVVADADWVFHLAALPRYDATVPESEYEQINVTATVDVMKASLAAGVNRFVFTSSIESVGVSTDGKPLTEESEPRPRNVYGRSKWEAEEAVRAFHREHGLHAVIARIGATFGPRESLVLSRIFRPASYGWYVLFGDGSALMEFCYVKNQVHGIWLCGEKGGAGETYFLSDPTPYSLRHVLTQVGEQLGRPLRLVPIPKAVAWVMAVGFEAASKVLRFYPFYIAETGRAPMSRKTLGWALKSTVFCDVSKAQRELGYEAPYTLAEGLAETFAWCRRHKLLR